MKGKCCKPATHALSRKYKDFFLHLVSKCDKLVKPTGQLKFKGFQC